MFKKISQFGIDQRQVLASTPFKFQHVALYFLLEASDLHNCMGDLTVFIGEITQGLYRKQNTHAKRRQRREEADENKL